MIAPVNTAVILAAGLGSRLGDSANNQPKAFLEFDGVTLIERSINLLIKKGITRIIIGTGHKSEFFDQLKEKYKEVVTVKNDKYAETGSMYTLYVARELVEASFLLLEGDLLYEAYALEHLLQNDHNDVILASDATNSGDEVFMEIKKDGSLAKMSKAKNELNSIAGELVGISMLTLGTLKLMSDFAEVQYQLGNFNIHYEDVMVGIAKERTFKVLVVKDLAWCEIDDPSHLKRANQVVYPKILVRG